MNDAGVFISHMGLGDIILLLPAIMHYASISKLLYVFCKDIYISTILPFLIEYKNIKIISVDSKLNQIDCETFMHNEVQNLLKIYKTISIYVSGGYNQNYNEFVDFPIHFYKDLYLDFHETLAKFNIINTLNSQQLYAKIAQLNKPYIFLHTSASNLDIELDINTSTIDVILINPEKNMYSPDHIFYKVAQECLRVNNNYTLIDYKLLIENATELHLIDSSYFCFAALCKSIKPLIKIVYSRYQQPFSTLLNDGVWQQFYYSSA